MPHRSRVNHSELSNVTDSNFLKDNKKHDTLIVQAFFISLPMQNVRNIYPYRTLIYKTACTEFIIFLCRHSRY